MWSKKSVFMAIVVAFLVTRVMVEGQGTAPEGAISTPPLRYDFYDDECERDVEEIVWSMMQRIIQLQHNAPAQLLRLLFHDCFIGGCDASVLLADSNKNGTAEREAIPNRTLKGFNFIDMIKGDIEAACPGVVSCSDILVLATRDGIVLAGGPYYPVLTGRRDSTDSFFDKAMAEIPRPNGNITETLRLFSLRGFDERETVALLGGHNVGRIGCEFIRPRLSNFMGTGLPDPTIPDDFLEELKQKCPEDNNTISNMFNERIARSLSESAVSYAKGLSAFGASFDNHYYKTLMRGRGILFADQQLMANEKTAEAVIDYASDDGAIFRTDFAHAMAKLSDFGVLTGSQGEVRRSCSRLNSS